MPFTFSHPAAILPLNYVSKRWLSLTALVAGSMIPDFEYFIRMRVLSVYSHTWPGLFWYDLPLALVALVLYNWLVKYKLIAHLPAGINRRFSSFQHGKTEYQSISYFIIILVSILMGAASHILWDSFTHPAGYFVKHHRILKHIVIIAHHSIEFYNMLQHISSLVGALIVIYSIYKLPKGELTNVSSGKIARYWFGIILITIAVVLIRLVTGLDIKQYGDLIMSAIAGFLLGLMFVSVFTPATKTI